MIKNQRHGQEAPNKLQQCCSCFVWSFQPTFNNLSLIYYKLWTSKLSRIIKWLSLEKLRGENNNNIKEIVRGDLAREKCKTTTSLPTFWTASKKGYWERALLILIKYKIILNAILSPPPSSLPITHLLFSPAEKRVLRDDRTLVRNQWSCTVLQCNKTIYSKIAKEQAVAGCLVYIHVQLPLRFWFLFKLYASIMEHVPIEKDSESPPLSPVMKKSSTSKIVNKRTIIIAAIVIVVLVILLGALLGAEQAKSKGRQF